MKDSSSQARLEKCDSDLQSETKTVSQKGEADPSKIVRRSFRRSSKRSVGPPQEDSKIRTIAVLFLGIILTILTVSGAIVFINSPKDAKDVWLIIGPLIVSGFSILGFVLGAKPSSK